MIKETKMKKTITALALILLAYNASAVSFDLSQSELDYKVVPPGTSKTMTLTLYVRGNKDMSSLMTSAGEMADWVTINESPLVLKPYKHEIVYLTLSVPEDTQYGRYTHKIYFSVLEYTGEESGMSVNIGLRLPLTIQFDVLGNVSSGIYSLSRAEIKGYQNKRLVLNESNTGDRILLLDYTIRIENDTANIQYFTLEDRIRPYSSRMNEIDLDTGGMLDGEYTLKLLVQDSYGTEYRRNVNFRVGSEQPIVEYTTTTLPEKTTTTTEPEITILPSPYKAMGLLALLAAYLVYRFLRSRQTPKGREKAGL